MIDLIIAYLALIVVILLFIIAFLTLYIIYEHRKININKDKRIIVPLLALKTNDKSSGDHSNSAIISTTHKRMIKRFRHRPRTILIPTQNSQGFLFSNGDLSSSLSTDNNKLLEQNLNSTIDQTTIHFDY